jgi:hypothetical protein
LFLSARRWVEQHIAAGGAVLAVYGPDAVRGVRHSVDAPESLVDLGTIAADLDQLRAGGVAENDAMLRSKRIVDAGVRGRRYCWSCRGTAGPGWEM